MYFTQRNAASKTSMIERRTAVVQVADSSGLILVIQIYNMNRMLSAVIFSVHSFDSKLIVLVCY